MKYTVRFFTRDIVNGEWDDEHELSRFESENPILVPQIGSIVCLADTGDVYTCVGTDYCYPASDDTSEGYETDVILEVKR